MEFLYKVRFGGINKEWDGFVFFVGNGSGSVDGLVSVIVGVGCFLISIVVFLIGCLVVISFGSKVWVFGFVLEC